MLMKKMKEEDEEEKRNLHLFGIAQNYELSQFYR